MRKFEVVRYLSSMFKGVWSEIFLKIIKMMKKFVIILNGDKIVFKIFVIKLIVYCFIILLNLGLGKIEM